MLVRHVVAAPSLFSRHESPRDADLDA